MRIVLASGSPRRKALLTMLGLSDFDVIPAKGEEQVKPGLTPAETVKVLAEAKADEVSEQCGASDVIIAADTIVWLDGQILGKPHSEAEAASMLRRLSGRAHTVYTGVAVLRGERRVIEAEASEVHFRALDEAEIEAYVASGEPMDKAGAYGAQGLAALFVERIEGDFFNVMGLPLCRLGQMLKKLDVRLL